MALQIIINNQSGPLPINATFTAPSDAPLVLEVNGSVWSADPGLTIGIGIDLDGNLIGKAQIFANPSETHLALVPAYITVELSEGQHTLNLFALTAETEADGNDFFNAVLHY